MTVAPNNSLSPYRDRRGFIAVCGISFATASLSEREMFHVGRAELAAAVKLFKTLPGVLEAAVLSTCNRFEAYLVLEEGTDCFAVMSEFWRRRRGCETADRRRLFYVRHGSTVARHLFRVISGLESLVLGEYQIQGQIKEAYSAACSAKGAGKALHKLFHTAFRVGKAVRSKTSLGSGQYSVAGVAVGLLKQELRRKDPVLLVGVNDNTRIVADGLAAAGFETLLFANRTAAKAAKTAARYGGEGAGLDALPALLARARGVVSCTGAPGTVIGAQVIEESFGTDARSVIVDMAVPRDVEAPKEPCDALRIVDLEDLKHHLEAQENGRRADLPAAESLIEDMVATFQAWMDSAFDPGVGNLAKEYERIRLQCLEQARGLFKTEDEAELERFSRELMRHFLRVPARAILESAEPEEKGACRRRKDKGGERKGCSQGEHKGRSQGERRGSGCLA